MYQEIILDHYRRPQGRGLREPFQAEVHHVNPTCGDEITLRVTVDDPAAGPDAKVLDVSYDGAGCSISQASASVLYDLVVGHPVGDAMHVRSAFQELMTGRGEVEPDEDVLGDAVAFAGVAKYPARVKCALLSWMAFTDAVGRTLETGRHRPDRRPRHDPGGAPMSETTTAPSSVDDVTEALKDVVDPELGINIVDLGLVYGVAVDDANIATIDMTLTSAACPLTDVIEDQTRAALDGIVNDYRVNWVWMPPWAPDKITDDGRDMLRALGFNL